MASSVLHIKDSYYFEVPKFMWRANNKHARDFPSWWVRLDADYQSWEAGKVYLELEKVVKGELPSKTELLDAYETWKHDHHNFAKPFTAYLEEGAARIEAQYARWQAQEGNADRDFNEFLAITGKSSDAWFAKLLRDENRSTKWQKEIKPYEGRVDTYNNLARAKWSEAKLEAYNSHLSGKILVPQPFGSIRNLYERDSGICISKYMVVQMIVVLIMIGVFGWLGKKIRSGDAPKGKLWNLLEAILLFMRDQVARPAIGGKDADKFVPLLWTIFLFVLGCNLFGMVPWVGAPTSAFGVTLGLALVTLATVVLSGSEKFGVVGFWTNQVPSMDLPLVMAIFIKPMVFAIEVLGLFIKHGVLAVRLLANMVAGHLVLLGIMMLAFSIQGALSPAWPITAVIAVIGSTLFSCLELFVAFLQAYVFAFLSALFIGAAIHHH